MPQTCRVCGLSPEKRKQLEIEFINGKNIHQLSKTYGMSESSVKFHTDNHLPEKLVKAAEKTFQLDTTHLVEQIDQLYSWMKIIFQRNYDKGYDRTALKALSEQRNTLQLLAQISVALHKTRVEELEYERERELMQSDLPLERLTKREKDVYFQITQKLLGDDKITIDLGYAADYPDVDLPRVRKKVVEQETKVEEEPSEVGSFATQEKDSLKNTPAPESKDDGMKFRPVVEEWNGKTDPKLKLTRRRFSRVLEHLEEDKRRPNTPGSPII